MKIYKIKYKTFAFCQSLKCNLNVAQHGWFCYCICCFYPIRLNDFLLLFFFFHYFTRVGFCRNELNATIGRCFETNIRHENTNVWLSHINNNKKLWFLQKNPKRKVEWPCTISMLINLKWPLIMLIFFSFFIAKMRYYSNAVVQPFDWHPSLRFRGGLLFTPK